METIWTVVLGLIQGATEFLPVSSSGHLAVGQLIIADLGFGGNLAGQPLTLEILLHLATLLAVILYFRRDVGAAVKGAGRLAMGTLRGNLSVMIREDDGANLALVVLVGTLPTGILGYLLSDAAVFLHKSPIGLGVSFLVCASFLYASKWWRGGERRISWRIALVIGIVQGLAVLPGISRSGITITAALAFGLQREQATKFSFLLSIPAIVGATILALDISALSAGGRFIPYAAGAAAAFGVGLAALFLLVRIVKAGRIWVFAPYVAMVGLYTLLSF